MPLEHVTALFQLSISHIYFYALSNTLRIICFVLFLMFSYFFYFILFFFINNIRWQYQIYVLFLELGFFALCQQKFIKHVMYYQSNFSWNAPCPIFFVILKGLYSFLRAILTEYSLFLATYCLLTSTTKSFIFSYQTASSLFFFDFFINDFIIFQLLCSFSRKVFSFNHSIFIDFLFILELIQVDLGCFYFFLYFFFFSFIFSLVFFYFLIQTQQEHNVISHDNYHNLTKHVI